MGVRSSAKSFKSNESSLVVLSGKLRTTSSEPFFELEFSADDKFCLVEEKNSLVSIKIAVSGTHNDCDAYLQIENQTVSFWRDTFGRISLYWVVKDGELYFSTRSRCLADSLDLQDLNDESFYSYACFSFVPTPLSMFDGINSLEAGSKLSFRIEQQGGKTSLGLPQLSYDSCWSEGLSPEIRVESDAIESLTSHLQKAQSSQFQDIKEENVAVFLSGGLDSALTAAALKRAGFKLTAYSLDFGPYGKAELPFAEQIAAYLKIPLVKVLCEPKQVNSALDETIFALDSAFGDGVSVPLYLLCKRAAQDGHKIAFNGEGGDQLFGGWANKPIIASSIYKQAEADSKETFLHNYMNTFHKVYGHETAVLSQERQNLAADMNLHKYLERALASGNTALLLHLLRRANILLKGAQNIQPRASNLAIFHGLKLRTLFCNKDLAEFSFSLSPELLLNGACEKYILKKTVESWLPGDLVYREKRGMGVPLSEWCAGPLWSMIGKRLNPERLQKTGYWKNDIAQKLALGDVSAAFQGRRIGEIIWLILSWEIWLQSVGICSELRSYNSFWPPLQLLKLRKEVCDIL